MRCMVSHVRLPNPRRGDDEITWHPAGATNALRIDLAELFAEVIDG